MRHDSLTIERDASERVRVDLNMGAGGLTIGGGAQKLLNADFTYNVGIAARARMATSPYSKVWIYLDIHGGIGSIRLIAD